MKMKKSVRKNYRFDVATDYNLRQLMEETGKTETQVVVDAIEHYYQWRLNLQMTWPEVWGARSKAAELSVQEGEQE